MLFENIQCHPRLGQQNEAQITECSLRANAIIKNVKMGLVLECKSFESQNFIEDKVRCNPYQGKSLLKCH